MRWQECDIVLVDGMSNICPPADDSPVRCETVSYEEGIGAASSVCVGVHARKGPAAQPPAESGSLVELTTESACMTNNPPRASPDRALIGNCHMGPRLVPDPLLAFWAPTLPSIRYRIPAPKNTSRPSKGYLEARRLVRRR